MPDSAGLALAAPRRTRRSAGLGAPVALMAAFALGCAGSPGPPGPADPADPGTPPGARPGEDEVGPGADEVEARPPVNREDAVRLEGPHWVVTRLDGQALLDRSNISLVFEDDRVSGNASCNRYAAEWTPPEAGRIRIGAPRATLRACAPALMDQERRFLELLPRFESVQISDEGELLLTTATGVVLRATPS